MDRARSRPTAPPTEARVFLIDDHAMVRYGIAQMLQQAGGFEVVGEATGAPEAMSGLEAASPDLVICDLMLAEGSGLELIKDVVAGWPDIRILVSSMHNDVHHAERALGAGASGYVTKEQSSADFLQAVRQVLRGRMYLPPRLADTLMQRALRSDDGGEASPVDRLSDRELEVFQLLGDGLTTRQIADKLALSVKTIETYRDHLKRKLGLDNSAQLMHRAIRWKVGAETTAPAGEAELT